MIRTLCKVILASSLCVVFTGSGGTTEPNYKMTEVRVRVSGRNTRKRIWCKLKVPGEARVVRSVFTFTSFDQRLRGMRRTDRRRPLYTALNTAGKRACPRLPWTPASPFPPSNFDANGNVTPTGKVKFGIPSDLSANVTDGARLSASYCTGCHQERAGYNYPTIDSAIRLAPMFYDDAQINRQMRANIVAYLNRFSL